FFRRRRFQDAEALELGARHLLLHRLMHRLTHVDAVVFALDREIDFAILDLQHLRRDEVALAALIANTELVIARHGYVEELLIAERAAWAFEPVPQRRHAGTESEVVLVGVANLR